MVLTPGELLLGSAILSLVVALGVRLMLCNRFVSRHECKRQHALSDEVVASFKRSTDVQYRMLRGLIVHSDMPPETKERLLNDRD